MAIIKNTTTALASFINAATEQTTAIEEGDYKMANKYYDKIFKSVAVLKTENTLESLYDLLSNPIVGVRLWAAYFLLPVYEKQAIKVLEGIEKASGIHSLTAETTIKEWRKGNLKL